MSGKNEMRFFSAMVCVAACAAFLSAWPVAAEDLTTNSGKVFKNYRVLSVSPLGIRISHSEGVADLLFADLPDETTARYSPNLKTRSGKVYESYSVVKVSSTKFKIKHTFGTAWIPHEDFPDVLRRRYAAEIAKAKERQDKRMQDRTIERNKQTILETMKKARSCKEKTDAIGLLEGLVKTYTAPEYESLIGAVRKELEQYRREIDNVLQRSATLRREIQRAKENTDYEAKIRILDELIKTYSEEEIAEAGIIQLRREILADWTIDTAIAKAAKCDSSKAAFRIISDVLDKYPTHARSNEMRHLLAKYKTDFAVQSAIEYARRARTYEEAIKILEKVIQDCPNHPLIGNARNLLAQYKEEMTVCIEIRKAEKCSDRLEAIGILEKVIEKYPSCPRIGEAKELQAKYKKELENKILSPL